MHDLKKGLIPSPLQPMTLTASNFTFVSLESLSQCARVISHFPLLGLIKKKFSISMLSEVVELASLAPAQFLKK
jgi:hypothetical protein